MEVSIVILNWNGKYYLEKFLPSVVEHSQNIADIYVADNASSDDSLEFLKSKYPEIKTIENDKNYGFAEGYNVALSKVESKYFILLNSDIEVTQNWIGPIIVLMEKDSSIAACQPKILSYKEKNKFEYAGASGGFIDRIGYPFCRGRIFQDLEEDKGQYDQNHEVFWATGACLFIRSELFFKYGGFDVDFFAHMEEIDLCWRLKNYGHKIYCCPQSTIYHIGGGTLPKNNPKKTYLNFKNNMILLLKNLPGDKVVKVFAFRVSLDLIAALKFLFEGHFADFVAVFKAYFVFYKSLNHNLKKRKQQPQNEVSYIYKGSIVSEHYICRVKQFSKLKRKFNS